MTAAHGIALVCALILNASANLLIKFGMNKIDQAGGLLAGGAVAGLVRAAGSPQLIAGGFCFAANLVFYAYALQKMKISVAYPIMVTAGFAIIVIVAGWQLGERLTVVQWTGVALILVGVSLVASHAGAQLK
ncbi:MAG: EamA family transporter [Planctomycetes bacterium]|nr:EamA family transporter [Planctomycetota bacterium]